MDHFTKQPFGDLLMAAGLATVLLSCAFGIVVVAYVYLRGSRAA